jgi:hypothetical protein
VPQEEDIEDNGEEERDGRDGPDDEGEQHGEVDDRLLLVAGLGHGLDVLEELDERALVFRGGMVTDRNELGLHDGPQGEGVDDHARSLSDYDKEGTWQS